MLIRLAYNTPVTSASRAGGVARGQHHLGDLQPLLVGDVDRRGALGPPALVHEAHVAGHAAGRVLGEVSVRQPAKQLGGRRFRNLFRQQLGSPLLPALDDLGAFGAQQIAPAAQRRARPLVQLAQQRLFPVGEVVRRHRAQIAEGQQVQLAQVLLVAAQLGEVGDHLQVLQIAALRHLPHHQVLAHQEFGAVDVLFVDPQAQRDLDGQIGADVAVGLAPRLADVVQQASR